MVIKTLQWNSGGGRVRKPGADIDLLASYCHDGLREIIELIKEVNPDIISLQETHKNKSQDQVQTIAKAVGLKYYISDTYADSHVEPGQKLGQGIISRFEISNHDFQLFYNPHFQVVWEDGSIAVSHDKGVTSCEIDIDDTKIALKTLHMIPFRRFGVDPLSKEAEMVLNDVQTKLKGNNDRLLIQGDFNFDQESLMAILPSLFTKEVKEIPQKEPTTPKGRKYDHIIYKGLTLTESNTVKDVLTDHYPVVSEFQL